MKRLILSGVFTRGCIHSTESVDSLPCAETMRGTGNTIVKKHTALPSWREVTNKSASDHSKSSADPRRDAKCESGAQRGVHGSEGRGALELFSERRRDTGRARTGRTGHRKDGTEQMGWVGVWQERSMGILCPLHSGSAHWSVPRFLTPTATHRARGGGHLRGDPSPISGERPREECL